jgi:hypothetical protein
LNYGHSNQSGNRDCDLSAIGVIRRVILVCPFLELSGHAKNRPTVEQFKPSMTNSVPGIPELSRMRTETTSLEPLHAKRKKN